MNIALYTHLACLQHYPGDNHPESPARLAAVLEALDDARFALLERIDAPRATFEQLARVHREDYINHILANEPHEGQVWLDPDTLMSPGSGEAALRAAGAVCAAIDGAFAGWKRRAFCAVRPPGHHARPAAAMGFCLFNNIAVGAAHAIATRQLDRVAIVDFDVHHGNGTQEIFWCDPRVMYVSTHQWPLYPDTGTRKEVGIGNMLNVPLPKGAGSTAFRNAYEDIILPALEEFAPQLLLISAGFDAHHLDPLGGLGLETADFAWLTHQLLDIAQGYAHGRVVSSLEGGYNLTALRECVVAHVGALMG
jgi:acetoin utilization deacetylase AcuC-like enzyme